MSIEEYEKMSPLERLRKEEPTLQMYEVVSEFIKLSDTEYFQKEVDEGCFVDPDKVDKLTDALQEFMADVIAWVINAGSERDAVNENEELREAIRKEVDSWKWVDDVEVN